MREIKFRAWLNPRWEDDDDANRMYYDIQDSYDNLGNVKPYDPMTSFTSWFNDEVAIVEQYTGLKDKNGKEIYEGDIIQTQYMNAKGWVVWSNGAWDIRLLKDTLVELFLAEEVGVGCEVIGNIHENPELLGGEE